MKAPRRLRSSSFLRKKAAETTGLKCAPETGPKTVMSAKRMPHVASVLPSSATPSSGESLEADSLG